jgi:HEAT repeat protein
VRVAAAWALGQIESSRAVQPLKAALQDESQDVQDAAGWALDQIDDERPVRVRVRPHVRKPI